MSDNYQIAIEICQSIIGRKASVTDNEINNAVGKATMLYSDVDAAKLKNDLLSMYSVKIDAFQILEGRERREPWLKDFRANKKSKWEFWTRYAEYLEKQKKFAPSIILQLDELTDKVLDKLFNPRRSEIQISKKGLVVGQVQSGKTSNYTGLICKAADAGFNLIVVLAGIHNNLRSQTQNRMDEGFLGFDTQYERAYTMNKTTKIGVGLIPGFENAIANSYTTSLEKGDFTSRATNTAGFNFNAPQPILLVVKKNTSVLKRLYNWLHTHTQTTNEKISNKSLLIIDDEADNASINTNRKELDPTTINRNICGIISLFNRSAYVGYTATPFANIFIPRNEDDLFPRDFIINIPAPTNYIGPEKVFGTSVIPDDTNNDLLPIVFPIKNYDYFVPQIHKKDDDKPTFSDIPESLKTAVKCFIVTCAVRIARGQGTKHNSMLIHVSRFQRWQNHIKELVEQLFNYYKHEIEAGDTVIYEEFRKILEDDAAFYKSYKTVTTEIQQSKFGNIDKNLTVHPWEEIKPLLFKAVQKVEVKSINGTSGDCLTYYENDINYLYKISEQSRVPIELDFENFEGEHFEIPCLSAANGNQDYKAYVAIIPGACLAKLYERYGARLLEQNVRSFLQFTGKINKGIRDTIRNEPHMFLAFNNGIAATADYLELDETNRYIRKIGNLQIVNGGQTTASIYNTAKKDKADISNIFVQVKFSIIEKPDQYSEIVSRISRCANTQNKVNDADFSANNPALVAFEKLSRYILSPITVQNNIQTCWFFERARGQYKTLRSREGFTKSRQKSFDLKYPNKYSDRK
jgi:hypothetical protein